MELLLSLFGWRTWELSRPNERIFAQYSGWTHSAKNTDQVRSIPTRSLVSRTPSNTDRAYSIPTPSLLSRTPSHRALCSAHTLPARSATLMARLTGGDEPKFWFPQAALAKAAGGQ